MCCGQTEVCPHLIVAIVKEYNEGPPFLPDLDHSSIQFLHKINTKLLISTRVFTHVRAQHTNLGYSVTNFVVMQLQIFQFGHHLET